MRTLRHFQITAALFLALPAALGAYSPPEDAAGPLSVRIEGPATIAQAGAPAPITVVLDNKGDAALQGTLRVQLIDGWRAEPSGAIAFSIGPRAAVRHSFTVTPAAGSYSAHYPIHVFAEFQAAGQELVAHPVLIVETRLPRPPRARIGRAQPATEWKPMELLADRGMALWRLPARRAVIQVFGARPLVMPAGWQGSEEQTRASVQFGLRVDRGGAREAIGIHPPYSQGRAGTALVEFPLRLPGSAPLKLRFANAIRDHTPPKERPSDGVTFRVRVVAFDAPAGAQGEVLFERHTDAKTWQEGEADLGRFAGRDIRLQLESHPGPKNDTNCDQSYWAEPVVVAGTPPAAPAFPPSAAAGSRLLGRLQRARLGRAGQAWEVRLWPGRRGLLDSVIAFGRDNARLFLQGFRVRVLDDALEDWRSPAAFIEAREEAAAGRYRVRHRFQSWAGGFDLVGELWTEAGALRAHFRLENAPAARPWLAVYLEDVSAGRWSQGARRVYAGAGNVLQEPQAFSLGFDGHRLSTSFVGFDFAGGLSLLQAVDVPPTRLEVDPAAGLYTLHAAHEQTLAFIPAGNIWEAVAAWRETNGLQAAPGVASLAGRFVFDLWGGRYGESAAALRRAARYGLRDALVVWHNWQRWGYDYRLPDIYPPNPRLGTFEEFQDLVAAARQNGMLFAPHDNYIDFYPDAEGFSYEKIAFHKDGQPVKAWFNRGREAQSYRWSTERLRPYLERNLRLIRDGFAPTAFFIDVWSSIGPYDSWTADGRFIDRIVTRDTWGEAFDWIRRYLGNNAPQVSESGHDQLIGRLDGAQTNHLRVDVPPAGEYGWATWPIRCADAERVPWFDAAHHDRFVLHGAGYETRYAAGLDRNAHGIYSDDYVSTEVLTGHPAMVKAPFGRDVVRKYWLLDNVMRALALRRIRSVEFAAGNLHRQHVTWDNGGEVWVNRGADDWSVAGHSLAQYGFYARIPAGKENAEAAVERLGGAVVEWARSPGMLYVNPRAGGPVSIGPLTAAGAVRLAWDGNNVSLTPLPESAAFDVRLRWALLPRRLPAPDIAEAVDESGHVLETSRLVGEGADVMLSLNRGVFAYRLRQ